MTRKPTPPSLRLLPGGHGTVTPIPRCQIAVQAILAGLQETRVQGENAQHTGRGHGTLTLRIGMVVLVLEDKDALHSVVTAVERAVELRDRAFGPELPAPRYGKRQA